MTEQDYVKLAEGFNYFMANPHYGKDGKQLNKVAFTFHEDVSFTDKEKERIKNEFGFKYLSERPTDTPGFVSRVFEYVGTTMSI